MVYALQSLWWIPIYTVAHIEMLLRAVVIEMHLNC